MPWERPKKWQKDKKKSHPHDLIILQDPQIPWHWRLRFNIGVWGDTNVQSIAGMLLSELPLGQLQYNGPRDSRSQCRHTLSIAHLSGRAGVFTHQLPSITEGCPRGVGSLHLSSCLVHGERELWWPEKKNLQVKTCGCQNGELKIRPKRKWRGRGQPLLLRSIDIC